MQNVLFIGGTGRVAEEAINILLSKSSTIITVATRKTKPNIANLKATQQERIKYLSLDVFNNEDLKKAIQDKDLVISGVGPSMLVGTKVLEACIEQGVACVDVGGYDPAFKFLDTKNTDQIKAPVIINAGLLPGLSAIFPLSVIASFKAKYPNETIDSLVEEYVGRDAWSYSSSVDIIWGMSGFGYPPLGPVHYVNKKLQKVSFLKAFKKTNFPKITDKLSVFLLHSEELIRLAQENDVSNLDVYGANIGKKAALSLMFTQMFKRFKNNEQVFASAKRLVKAAAKDLEKDVPYYAINVEVKGKQNQIISSSLVLPDTYKGTGIVLGTTALTVLNKDTLAIKGSLHETISAKIILDALFEANLLEIITK